MRLVRHGLVGVACLALAAAAYALWKRLRGGSDDDDWGSWEPEPPAPSASAESTSTTA